MSNKTAHKERRKSKKESKRERSKYTCKKIEVQILACANARKKAA